MRAVPPEISGRLVNKVQTKATNADPSLHLWLSRKSVPLRDKELLEVKDVTTGATDVDIAVKHTKLGDAIDAIYLAFVTGGRALVQTAVYQEVMSRHTFFPTTFSVPAEKVAIAFDGKMPRKTSDTYEFITEEYPWVFWLSGGAVYGRWLGGWSETILAEKNATAISAVRAMWSDVPGFDFGLCLFMILEGTIYVRQYIGGAWYDAEPLPAAVLPVLGTGVYWTQIDASRTWDYRVILQVVASDGMMFEVLTQYGGIGSKNAEHIEIKDISASGQLIKINYHDTRDGGEHIEITDINADGFLWSTVTPAVGSSAVNINDGAGDWGRFVTVKLNEPILASTLTGQAGQFKLTDSRNRMFTAIGVTVSRDGRTLKLEFSNFNAAYGLCGIAYTPGTVASGILAMAEWSVSFTPTHLVPPIVDPPEVVEVTNV